MCTQWWARFVGDSSVLGCERPGAAGLLHTPQRWMAAAAACMRPFHSPPAAVRALPRPHLRCGLLGMVPQHNPAAKACQQPQMWCRQQPHGNRARHTAPLAEWTGTATMTGRRRPRGRTASRMLMRQACPRRTAAAARPGRLPHSLEVAAAMLALPRQASLQVNAAGWCGSGGGGHAGLSLSPWSALLGDSDACLPANLP